MQTILGFVLFIKHYKNKHYSYHGAIVTEWNSKTSISLGMYHLSPFIAATLRLFSVFDIDVGLCKFTFGNSGAESKWKRMKS